MDKLTEKELADIDGRRKAAKAKARRQLKTSNRKEDTAIEKAARADPDAQPMTATELAEMRPAHEILPSMVAEHIRNKGGRPKAAVTKKAVSIRLDPDVLTHFRDQGPGWQSRINSILRRHVVRNTRLPEKPRKRA